MQPFQICTRDIVRDFKKKGKREKEIKRGAVKSSFSGVDALIEHYYYQKYLKIRYCAPQIVKVG